MPPIPNQEFYEKLIVKTGKSKDMQALRVIVITDLGKDHDYSETIVVLKELFCLNLIHLERFIINIKSSYKRAIVRRIVLDLLGL